MSRENIPNRSKYSRWAAVNLPNLTRVASGFGCVRDHSDRPPGYEDFLYDFCESFAVQWLLCKELQSMRIQRLALLIQEYVAETVSNSIRKGPFSELVDENLDHVCKRIVDLSKCIDSEYKGDDQYNFKLEVHASVFKKRKFRLRQLEGQNYLIPVDRRFPKLPSQDNIESPVLGRFNVQKSRLFYLFGSDNPNLLKTISGWWWNPRKQTGYLDRPIARDIVKDYGCLMRFIIQVCERDQIRVAEARKKLEENLRASCLYRIKSRLDNSFETDTISFAEIEYTLFSPYMIDIDTIEVWLALEKEAPFTLDREMMCCSKIKKITKVGWISSDDDEDGPGIRGCAGKNVFEEQEDTETPELTESKQCGWDGLLPTPVYVSHSSDSSVDEEEEFEEEFDIQSSFVDGGNISDSPDEHGFRGFMEDDAENRSAQNVDEKTDCSEVCFYNYGNKTTPETFTNPDGVTVSRQRGSYKIQRGRGARGKTGPRMPSCNFYNSQSLASTSIKIEDPFSEYDDQIHLQEKMTHCSVKCDDDYEMENRSSSS